MNLKTKLFASAVAFTMVLSIMPIMASAQTTAELTAQINSLLAMIAQLQSQIAGGSTTTTGGTNAATSMFDKDLTVGSTGSNVVDLQRWLVNNQYLTMPAGVAYGYFGNLTKAAVARFQVAKGITPAVGYFGPKTMAVLNAMLAASGTGSTTTTTTTPGCGVGALYSSTTGALCSTTTTTTGGVGITTPGAEGTITVTSSNANVVSTAYAGDSKDKILGFKVQAAGSDVAVQRVKVDLGVNTTQYNKEWQTLYVVDDAGNALASLPMNSSTVVKDSGEYYATLTGMNAIVSKGTNRQFYIAADLYPSIDSAITAATGPTIQLADSGVRAVDGAGIDQYGPSTGSTVSNQVSLAGSLSDEASLTVSSNASTPSASTVVATDGADNNQYDKLSILTFDVQAKKDSVEITDAVMCIVKSGTGTANASSTYYLFDGSTPIGSASAGYTGCATFSNVNYTVPKDTTKTLTLKADIRLAGATGATFTGYASSTGMTAESSDGSTIAAGYLSGSVTGNGITVRSAGPVITLTSKSITTSGTPESSGATTFSTSTLTATFNLHITAVGGPVTFGTVASTAPAFASSTTGFKVYLNGAAVTAFLGYGTSTSFSFPSACSTAGQTGGNSCVLSENSSMDVPVSFITQGRSTNSTALSSGLYSVQLSGVQYVVGGKLYSGATAANFMDGLADWRTSDVSFP